jgi:hypothetical protein
MKRTNLRRLLANNNAFHVDRQKQQAAISKRVKALRARADNLEKKGYDLPYSHFVIDHLKTRFLREVQRILGAESMEFYGPFGLNATTTVYFMKDKKQPDICKRGATLGSLSFQHRASEWVLLTPKVRKGWERRNPSNDYHDDRFEVAVLTEDMTPEWAAKYAKRRQNNHI